MEGFPGADSIRLQVAARRPPALKAIITHCSTDDRYADDTHYKGGCILEDMFDWGTAFSPFKASHRIPISPGGMVGGSRGSSD